MKIRATVFLVFLFPALALSQQALVEKGLAELYFSGAVGVGNQTRLYGGEIGAGLNGEAAISIAYASVDHKNSTWHTATITPSVTLAFHSKNTREQSILVLNLGVTTGKASEYGGNQGKSINLGVAGFVKKPLNSKVILLPGAGMAIALPRGESRGSAMAVGVGVTMGFRFDWAPESYGFIIPGVSIAGEIKAVTLEAGIGFKGKFRPQSRRE